MINVIEFKTNKERAKARRRAESRLFWHRVLFIGSVIEIMRQGFCSHNVWLMGIACVIATLTAKESFRNA